MQKNIIVVLLIAVFLFGCIQQSTPVTVSGNTPLIEGNNYTEVQNQTTPIDTSLKGSIGQCGTLIDNGLNTIKIAFMSEGLNDTQQLQFQERISQYIYGTEPATTFFGTEPYKSNQNKFSFYRIDNKQNFGCKEGQFLCDTAVNTIAESCNFDKNYDIIMVIIDAKVNGREGGIQANGYYVGQGIVSLTNPLFSRTLSHELAHAIADAKDFYPAACPTCDHEIAINSIMGNPITANQYDAENKQLICNRINGATGSVNCS